MTANTTQVSAPHWTDTLATLGACHEAREWAKQFETFEEAWNVCEDHSWLDWVSRKARVLDVITAREDASFFKQWQAVWFLGDPPIQEHAVCARIRELLPAPEAARIFAKLAEKVGKP